MKIRIRTIVVIFLLSCFFMRLMEARYDGSFNFINDLILISFFAIFIVMKDKLKVNFTFILCFLILFAFWLCSIFTGSLLEALTRGRLIIISFSYIIIFYCLINANLSEKSIIDYNKGIALILNINILFMVIEIFAQMIGYRDLFTQFFPKYRDLPSFTINSLFDLNIYAPVSLIFEAQSASIISLMGIIFYTPILKGEKMSSESYIWLSLAVICYVISITVTALICLASYILFLIYFLKNSKINKLLYKVSFALAVIYASFKLQSLFLLKYGASINDAAFAHYWESYMEIFLSPIILMREFSIFDLLFGKSTSYIARFAETSTLLHGDFGFGVLIINFGLIVVVFLTILYAVYSIRLIHNINKQVKNDMGLCNIIAKNYLCTLVASISLIHYTIFFYAGMIQLIAFQIAFTCVLITYMRVKTTHAIVNDGRS